MNEFEYQTVRLGMVPEEITGEINRHVSIGWELVQALYNDVCVLGIFRRPKVAAEPQLIKPKAQRRETRG